MRHRAAFIVFITIISIALSAGAAMAASNRFVDNGNGTVLDVETGLMWAKNAMYFEEAVPIQIANRMIGEMNSGGRDNYGFRDWRLPEVQELASLLDPDRYYPALPIGHPFKNVQPDFYWTRSGGFNMIGYAWVVDMASGAMRYESLSYCNFNHVWPVRVDKASGGARVRELAAKVVNEKARMLPTDLDFLAMDQKCEQNKVASMPPPTPLEVTAVAISPTEIMLSWNPGANIKNLAWYNVYSNGEKLKSSKTASTNITNLNAGQERCYYITSYTDDGQESERSRDACTTTWTEITQGTVWGMGLNNYGQLGDGTRQDRHTLVVAKKIEQIEQIGAGVEHAAVVDKNGDIWSWGRNSRGELGDGTLINRSVPTRIEKFGGVAQVSSGWYHTLALQKDGTVWAWGRNYYGQLGNGSTVDSMVPVQVKNLTDVKAIAAGWYHSIALKKDGTVWAWGWNYSGQTGGKKQNTTQPIQIQGLMNIKAIAGGMYHSLALQNNGDVWSWGRNDYGQLGDGTKVDSPFPVRVRDVSNVSQISCGMYYSLALKPDGTVWAWGRNDYNQLGPDAGSEATSAVKVKDVDKVVQIAAGAHHAVAVKDDGSVWMWGWDFARDVKNSPPVKLGPVTGITDASAGLHYTVILKKD